MNVIIYNTEQEAKDRNKVEAVLRGCSGVTIEWWNRLEGVSGEWALLVKEDIVPETTQTIDETWIKIEEEI